MKPRTKLEKQLLEMASQLPPVRTDKLSEGLFPDTGLYRKNGLVWCQCCGHTEEMLLPELYVSTEGNHVCPACRRSITLSHDKSMGERNEQRSVSVLTTFRGVNVIRMFLFSRRNKLGEQTSLKADEVYQIWITDSGKEVITGRRLVRSPLYEHWDLHSPFSIKRHNASCGGCYVFDDAFTSPASTRRGSVHVTKTVRRNGFTGFLRHLSGNPDLSAVIRAFLTDRTFESLVKQRQYAFASWMLENPHPRQLTDAARICSRHGYIIRDASLWVDYIRMLHELGRDTRNPHYICPADLREEHDRVADLLKRREERHRESDIRQREETYRKQKGRFFGIEFGDGEIHLHVIRSVREMKEEGDAMHHCVYQAKYHERPESLILSARDSKGNRIETVEVNLTDMRIAQSRAKHNAVSSHHDRIMQLVTDHMELIRRVR